jgi:hypothetical protein
MCMRYTLRAMAWFWSAIDRPWSFEPLGTEPLRVVEPTYKMDVRINNILSIGALIVKVGIMLP